MTPSSAYTMVVSFGMAVVGAIMLLTRFGKIQLAMAEGWEDEYQVKKVERNLSNLAPA